MPGKTHLVILDSNAIIHRAYHALPPFSTSNGTQVNAVYGYASLLLKIFTELKPDSVLAAFDVEGKTFRHQQYQEYKAHREKADQELYDQIPLVQDLVSGLGIPEISLTGYEADDVIGTIAKHVTEMPGYTLTIVTGDMDSMQLVNKDVSVYRLRKGVNDTLLYDTEAVVSEYGIRPDQVIDYKALQGDASDNIPGVPGIGKKRAQGLLLEFNSLEDLYHFVDSVSEFEELAPSERRGLTKSVFTALKQYKEQAYLSQSLATIDSQVPIEITLDTLSHTTLSREKATDVFSKYEFFSLIKRLPTVQGTNSTHQDSLFGVTASPEEMIFTEVDTWQSLGKVLGLSMDQERYRLVSTSGFRYVSEEEIKHVLQQSELHIIVHDSKEWFHRALQWNIQIKAALEDLSIMGYLLQPGERAYDVESLSLSRKIPYQPTHPEYSFVALFQKLNDELVEQEMLHIYTDIERPLTSVLSAMEHRGILLDVTALQEIGTHVSQSLKALEETIYDLAGTECNINSPKQLSELLFTTLHIPTQGIKKTQSGHISTSAEVLESLADRYEIVRHILEYRELSKLQSTYIEALPKLVDSNSRVHTQYKQTIAATGRLSSIDPNLQNIPARTELGREVRACFCAEPGWKLLFFDYSQIELRLAAHLSGDSAMKQIFLDGTDFHTATAARVYQLPVEEVTKAQRSFAKTINFGILYGMGAHALARNLGSSYGEAQEMLKKYTESFPELSQYIQSQKDFAHQHGYAKTDLGRRRILQSFNTKNYQQRALMERIAVNMPIQGLQADIIKKAMIEIHKTLEKKDDIRMLLQVHDELIFEVKESSELRYQDTIIGIMQNQYQSSVPLIVSSHISTTWS